MKMQETGCGRSFLPGQQSPSPLFGYHGLGTDGTLLPHGTYYRDLQKTAGQDRQIPNTSFIANQSTQIRTDEQRRQKSFDSV